MNKKLLSIGMLWGMCIPLFAQTEVISNNFLVNSNFLIAVIAGILLAFGFQFLLTTLSVAIGIVSVGNIKETYVKQKYSSYGISDDDDDDDNSTSSMNTGVMITSGFGLWNVVTLSIALFGATYLALQLSPTDSVGINLTLGLVIWSSFFMLMFYLEGQLISSLVGSLISTVLSGLRASSDAIKSVFVPSTAQQTQQLINNTIQTVRNELAAVDTNGINDTIDNFLARVDNRMPSYDKLKQDILEVVQQNNNSSSSNNSNGKEQSSVAKWTAIQAAIQTAVENSEKIATGKVQGQKKLNQLNNLVSDIQAEYKKGGSSMESISKVASRVTSLNEADAKAYMKQITDTLQAATPNDFSTGKIQQQIEQFVSNSSKVTASVQQQIEGLDRDTIVDTLSKNTSLDRKQINTYADNLDGVLRTARMKVTNLATAATDVDNWKNVASSIEGSIANFIDSTDNEELDYSLLKNDFTRAMNNPADSLDIVKHRLNTFNRDTVVSLITNNKRINRSDINSIADQVESARQEVMQQVEFVETKTRAKVANIERKAVIQAEAIRKTMASAAIWLLLTMLFSGGAAILGSMIEIG